MVRSITIKWLLGALEVFVSYVKGKLVQINNGELKSCVNSILKSLETIVVSAKKYAQEPDLLETFARQFAFKYKTIVC
jgi:hypothetical protein